MEQNRVQIQTHTNSSLRNVQGQSNGESITFSANNAGTIGDTLAKKNIISTSLPIQKLTQNGS